jgi:hypothetical protein
MNVDLHPLLSAYPDEDWHADYNILVEAQKMQDPYSHAEVLKNEVLVWILLSSGVVPSDRDLTEACRKHYVNTVYYLLQDGRADPRADNSQSLRHAALADPEILRMLLEDGRADPNAGLIPPLLIAVRYGTSDNVRLLLEDGRADPTIGDNMLIEEARRGRRIGIIAALEKDGRAK